MFTRLATALFVLAAATGAQAQSSDKLAFLIPTLYGPQGLFVESDALLPNGDTHSAHFNSAFQAEFTQFNISLASQLSSLPLPSPASGFVYELDPALGVFKRSTRSFGPILADRAETIGKKKLALGFNAQRFTFDTIEGIDLSNVPAVFTHDDFQLGGGRLDVVDTRNSIDLKVSQFTAFADYGLTDRIDLAVAVPVVTVDLAVSSDAHIDRLGTGTNTLVHYFHDPAGNRGDERVFSKSGTASGIGDVVVRAKALAIKSGSTGLALGVDVRFPTGDEEDLLGSGAMGVKPFLILSVSRKIVSPHVNIGYQWNGKSVLAGNVLTGEKATLPKQILYQAGLDIGVTQRVTFALDVLGRRVMDSPRLFSETFTAADSAHTSLPNIRFATGQNFSTTSGAMGVKFNAGSKLLVDVNAVFKLNDAGLRDKVTPLIGIEYSF